jgi:hypothetical protein
VIPGSSFLAFGTQTEWREDHGITHAHWEIFSSYAFAKDYYVFIRGGKAKAIKWIDLGFPGKPMELAFLKVDPDLGLLKVKEPLHYARVYALGHSVVKEKDLGSTRELVAFLHDQGRPLAHGSSEWAKAGVVIDQASGKPFTSDYDLWSVVDARRFDYMATIGSDPLLGHPAGGRGKTSHTSWLVEEVRTELNAVLEGKRFLHGSQAQILVPEERLEERDRVIGFCPDGKSVYFEGTTGHLEDVFKAIYADLSGPGRYVFEQ